jgi:SagB-type dehydrogenase family enzyme
LVSRAPVTFIFTSSFHRSSWKYGKRSYRYCCLDAGHLVVQASLAAAGLGFGSVPIGRFNDERVNALLGLDEDEEGAMAILPVGFVDNVSSGPEDRPEFDLAPKELEGRSHALVRLMHGSTRLAMTGRTVQAFPARALPMKELVEPVVYFLPGDLVEGDDLFPTILRRRSMRTWSPVSLTLEELAAMAYYAYGLSESGGEVLSDPSFEDNHALSLYVIVNEVEELEPGVYYYDRSHHELVQIRRGDHRQQAYAASLFQDVVGEAHVAFVMTADLKRLGYPDGDRGYRYANLDAGMLGGRLYLMATGLNLGCCGIGAFFDDEVSELIDVSPEEELVLYLVAVGVPEEAP